MSSVNRLEVHSGGEAHLEANDRETKVMVDIARLSLSAITVAELGERYTVDDDGTLIVNDSEQDFDAFEAALAAR